MIGNFSSKMLLHLRCAFVASKTHNLFVLENHSSILFSLRCISTKVNQDSFTVSYLINSCSLSPESAQLASKKVQFETTEKPDSVINLFKDQGFSQTLISDIIEKYPQVLLFNAQRNLLPKFDFLYSQGFSSTELGRIFSRYPFILRHSLKARIIPNIVLLREQMVPKSNIGMLLWKYPRTLTMKCEKVKETVEQVKKMGIDFSKSKFVVAFKALIMKKSTWERKWNLYRKWGWSEEEVAAAFLKCPGCMMLSEEKIMSTMEFHVNKMGLEASVIARRPIFVMLSLEKRIIPRYAVLQVLLSKNLVKKGYSLQVLLESPEKKFLEKFVACYKDEVPHLLRLYQEKLGLSL